MLNLNATLEETKTISKIANRAVAMQKSIAKQVIAKVEIELDITATHLNGNPLDLQELLNADDLNFSHDVFGIYRHLDRRTGKLGDCFSPRYSKRTKAVA